MDGRTTGDSFRPAGIRCTFSFIGYRMHLLRMGFRGRIDILHKDYKVIERVLLIQTLTLENQL